MHTRPSSSALGRRSALVVAPNVPWPPWTYSYQVVVAKLDALSQHFDVTFCTGVWNSSQDEALHDLGRHADCEVTGIKALAARGPVPRAGGKILSLAQSALGGVPAARLQVCHPLLRRHLRRLVARQRFDLVQVDYWYMGLGWLPTTAPTVCYAHDLDFMRVDSAGRSGERVRTSGCRAERLKTVELRALGAYRAVAAISPPEAERLRELLPAHVEVAALPAGIDTERLSAIPAPTQGCQRVLFVGALGSGPNTDAVRWLSRDIWPRVLAAMPNAVLSIVGGGASEALRLELSGPAVHLSGPVDDVAPHYAGCAAVVAPLRWGSGTKGKVLEALAAGRPLVATPVALEGIDAQDGRECLVGSDARAIADAIVQVLKHHDLAEALSVAGRRLVEQRYERSACMRRYLAFVDDVAGRGLGGHD